MQVWIDNTGLQSAALCLEGKGSTEHDLDIRGILQLATLMVFSNRIVLNGFEHDTVSQRSCEVVDHLHSICSATERIISIAPITEAEYGLACKTTTDWVAPDLCEVFNPHNDKLQAAVPPNFPTSLTERNLRYMKLVGKANDSDEIRRTLDTALEEKAVGAVGYMLAYSQQLREAICQLQKQYPSWSDESSYQLNIFLRYYLNYALGEQNFTKYAPAIARAELVELDSRSIINVLGTSMDKVVTGLRDDMKPLGVPSTVAALLERSKGEPKAIFEVVGELRERSKPLRNALEKLLDKYSCETPESYFEFRKEIVELGDQLMRTTGLKERPRFADAVDVRFVIGVPIPYISGNKLCEWIRDRWKSRRIAVLTEIVKAGAFSEDSIKYLDNLRHNATRHSA